MLGDMTVIINFWGPEYLKLYKKCTKDQIQNENYQAVVFNMDGFKHGSQESSA